MQRIVDYAIAVFGRRRGLMLDQADVQPLMALMTAAIYCAPIILIPMFDRYLLPLAPLLAYWLLATGRPAWTTPLAPALSALVCATWSFIQFSARTITWRGIAYAGSP